MSNQIQLRQCPECLFRQPHYFSFCGQCGTALASPCPQCQQAVPSGAVFCVFCGNSLDEIDTPLPRRTPPPQQAPPLKHPSSRQGQRRRVVVLFADICGFTAMSEKLDPEEVTEIINPLFQQCSTLINKYGGTVDKFMGDAVMAIFGVPTAHEDDPERALLTALDMQKMTEDYSISLQESKGLTLNLRIGLHVGLVVADTVGANHETDYTVIGDAVNTAARMEQNADPGTILVTEDIYETTHQLFAFEKRNKIKVKGKSNPIQTYELISLKRHMQRERGFSNQRIPFVGRKAEKKQLRVTAQEMLQGQFHFTAIEGDAGLGKSRLIRELIEEFSTGCELHALEGYCTSYSKHFSYFLLQSLLKNTLGVNENTSRDEIQLRLYDKLNVLNMPNREMTAKLLEYLLFLSTDDASLRLLSPEQLQQQIFRILTEFFIQYAEDLPLIILIDDLHWCDRLSLEWLHYFKNYLDESKRLLSLMILGTYRDKNEIRTVLDSLQWKEIITLHPLLQKESNQLINYVLEIEDSPADLAPLYRVIWDRSGGNPYYIEEVLKTLINGQLLVKENEVWKLTCSLKQLPLPDTIQSLIMTRSDNLNDEARALLQMTAVIGKRFSYKLLKRIYNQKNIDNSLDILQKQGFLMVEHIHGEQEILFPQALTQEVIYNTLLHKRKAELHKRVATSLEEMYVNSGPTEVLELLAHHFTQTKETQHAIKYLYLAASKVAKLYASNEALDDYARALELLEECTPDTFLAVDFHHEKWYKVRDLTSHIMEQQNDIYFLIGEYDQALKICDEALKRFDNIYSQARFYLKKGQIFEKRSDFGQALEFFNQGRKILEQNVICLEMAKLWNATGWVYQWTGQYQEAIDACNQALAILQQVPDMQEIAYANNVLGVVYYYQRDWDRALECYYKSLAIQEKASHLWGMANSLSNIGNVYAVTNRWAQAIEYNEKSLELREKQGNLAGVATSCNNLGHIFQETGDYEQAITHLERALGIQKQLKNELGYAVSYSNLGLVYQKLKKWQEAITHLEKGAAQLRELNAEEILPEVLTPLAEIYLEINNLENTLKILEEAENLIKKSKNKELRAKIDELFLDYKRKLKKEQRMGVKS